VQGKAGGLKQAAMRQAAVRRAVSRKVAVRRPERTQRGGLVYGGVRPGEGLGEGGPAVAWGRQEGRLLVGGRQLGGRPGGKRAAIGQGAPHSSEGRQEARIR
jgi:hypothetical protein